MLDKNKKYLRDFLGKILISSYLMFIHFYAIAQEPYICDKLKTITSNFIDSHQDEDWGILERNVYKLKQCKCEVAPVLYYIHRMKIVLPNTHALRGISPDDFVSKQKFIMHQQVKILKNCNEKNYLPLINSMIEQNFDEEVSNSAKDLKQQL